MRKITKINSDVIFHNDDNSVKSFSFDVNNLTSHKNLILPDASITLVGASNTQTITSKTIDALNNTILNISNVNISDSAAIDVTKIGDGSVSNTQFNYLASLSSGIVGAANTQTFSNKTIDADVNTILNIGDENIRASAGINTEKIADGSVSNAQFQRLSSVTSPILSESAIQTITNKQWGDVLDLNGNRISNIGTPTSDGDGVNKEYVDGLAAKRGAKLASTQDLDANPSILGVATYNNVGGTSERGLISATLSTTNLFIVDGTNLSSVDNGIRILVKDQTDKRQNGIYTLSISGTLLTLDRSPDFDSDSDIGSGAFFFIESGSTHAESGFVLISDSPLTVGGAFGSNLEFAQFSGGQINAGTGLSRNGTVLNVNGSSTIIANEDSLEINSSSVQNQLLLSSGTIGVPPTFGGVPLSDGNAVDGILPIVNGGTNTSGFTAGAKLVATNSSNTGLETIAFGSDDIQTKKSSVITTTDATQTTIASISTQDDESYFLRGSVVAKSATAAYAYSVSALFRNNSGSLTLVSTDHLEIADPNVEWSVDTVASGTSILIRISGATGETINWKIDYSTMSI